MKTRISLEHLAMMAMIVGLSGCASHPTKQEIGTATGAVIGGVTGAALTGGSTAGTVGGAAVGGVIGNQIGRDLERKRVSARAAHAIDSRLGG